MTKALLASSVLTVRHLNCWRWAALLLLLDYVSRYVSAFADVLRAELTFGTFWTAFLVNPSELTLRCILFRFMRAADAALK